MKVIKEVQEVKVGGRTRRVHVRPFAWNLHAPTHMEWAPDGRLLVVERTTGKVKDITKGGDMEEAKPFAWGLEGPSSMCPLPDGRLLISEFWGGRILDISSGGPASKAPVFCEGLIRPYSITSVPTEGSYRVFVVSSSEKRALEDVVGQVSEISNGKALPFLTQIPSRRSRGTEGFTPPWSWPEEWSVYASQCSKKSWTTFLPGEKGVLILAVSSLGRIIAFPVQEGPQELPEVAKKYTIAFDLDNMGGIIGHPYNGFLYVSQPATGSVLAIDPKEVRAYSFDPPVVTNLPSPSCVRFSPDGQMMFVCSPTNGVVWKVEGVVS